MTVLAVETATIEVGVALATSDGALAAASVRAGRRQAETLHPLLAEILERSATRLSDLEAVAVDVGPGLFTGLRVGIAAAKAIAFANSLPVVEVTSTDVLLHAARLREGRVAAVVDLRRGEVAWALSGTNAEPRRGTPEALAAALVELDEPVLLVGDGAMRHGEAVRARCAEAGVAVPEIAGDEMAAPPVAALAAVALERLAAGETVDPFAVAPRYLRDADVRINWATRDEDAAVGAGRGAR